MRYVLTFLLVIVTIFTSFGQVVMRDTTIQFQHFDFEMDEYYGLSSYSSTEIVTTSFNGIVLENELVKICLIPEFGGRIISFIYKPTGKEQLYQNPVGTPYQINTGIFYHDWLMVYGGIFPTFPDPEHGKYWNTPWKSEILLESPEKITISMSQKDTLNNPNRPGQYSGITGITCRYNVSLATNQPYFTADVELENDATPDNYEYWTCITFAPGSESGNTYSPANSEMIVPIEEYKMGWNPGNWMLGLDDVLSNNGAYILEYDKLAHLSNWEDMGIAYAHPTLESPYYGVINHENEQGLFRLSSDQSTTPGMKFWTWGNERGLSADPTNFNNEARPYIELWSGVSNEFFQKSSLGANEKVGWTETYLPTVGIPGVGYLNEEIVFNSDLTEGLLNIMAFDAVADADYQVEIRVTQDNQEIFTDVHSINPNPAGTSAWTLDLNQMDIEYGIATAEVNLLRNRQVWFTDRHTYEQTVLSSNKEGFDPILYASNDNVNIEFATSKLREIELYNTNGQLLEHVVTSSEKVSLPYPQHGVYIVSVVDNNKRWVKKIGVR